MGWGGGDFTVHCVFEINGNYRVCPCEMMMNIHEYS